MIRKFPLLWEWVVDTLALAGIVFGVVAVTGMFSRVMSMNPLNVDPPRQPEARQQLVYSGRPLTLTEGVAE